MKLIALLSLVMVAGFLGGCTADLPAHSAKERFQLIGYYDDYQQKECNSEIDCALLLRPMTLLTQWNVFHRD